MFRQGSEFRHYEFKLAADNCRFLLGDESDDPRSTETVMPADGRRLVKVGPGSVAFETGSETQLRLLLEVCEAEPFDDPGDWQKSVDCRLELRSGIMVVAGGKDYYPDAARFRVSPGCYRVRIDYDSTAIEPGSRAHSPDEYRVLLWPEGED